MDTGSNTIQVMCSPCYNCRHTLEPLFTPSNSASYKTLSCADVDCISSTDNSCQNKGDTCTYDIAYLGGVDSNGVLATDDFFFDDFHSRTHKKIIWYGAWTKKSSENKASLNATLKSILTTTISSMATLIEQRFFDPYAGESRDGTSAAKFSIGDIISVSAVEPHLTLSTEPTTLDITKPCLDNFKSRFAKMDGVGSGACLKSQVGQRIACLYMWKSLEFCYAWILSTDYRKAMVPYIDNKRISLEVKFDVFRVVYVSCDGGAGSYPRYRSPRRMLEREEERKEGHLMQN